MALDDKLYQRDLEVALALSVKEVPAVTIDVEQSQGKRNFIFCNYLWNLLTPFVIISLDELVQGEECTFNTLDYKMSSLQRVLLD